jgi:hypothetical protein
MFSSTFINILIVILELRPVDFHMMNTLDVPAQTKINLLNLPVLEKNSAPDARENAVGEGISWKPEPRDNACYGGESEEEKISLDEGEVKSDLGVSASILMSKRERGVPLSHGGFESDQCPRSSRKTFCSNT